MSCVRNQDDFSTAAVLYLPTCICRKAGTLYLDLSVYVNRVGNSFQNSILAKIKFIGSRNLVRNLNPAASRCIF